MPNIIFGLLTMALGLWGLSVWWWSVAEMLRGLVPILLILLGLVALGAGVTRIREADGAVGSAGGPGAGDGDERGL
ncbi:MAG: hypothetical protein HQL82_14625 [Magnetococcales bacterium]|nr:hypothetical protein [Magnetococcales bacterium]